MRAAALIAAALSFGACASAGESPPEAICTTEARASLAVTVTDAGTGQNLAPEATVRVTDGTFTETLTALPGSGVYSGVYERPGTYTVIVSHPDYAQWQRAGIVVGRDECHVITEEVAARLAYP